MVDPKKEEPIYIFRRKKAPLGERAAFELTTLRRVREFPLTGSFCLCKKYGLSRKKREEYSVGKGECPIAARRGEGPLSPPRGGRLSRRGKSQRLRIEDDFPEAH